MPEAPFFNTLDRVDSTNNYAMAKVHAGLARHGMAWFAKEQTAGKGQRGKSWEAEPGKNIAMSIVLQPEWLNISNQFYLNAAMAVGCFNFFREYADSGTKIKWPNDLYWRDRKAGGILIENIFQGALWKFSIVGIGININQVTFNDTLKNPVSLKQITGMDHDCEDLAKVLCSALIMTAEKLKPSTFHDTMETYNEHLFKRNENVRLKKGNMVFETVVKGVSGQGRLLTNDSTEREFDFGEVEWLL